MMSMVDLVPINVKVLTIESGHCFEKEFVELICMNSRILLYLN